MANQPLDPDCVPEKQNGLASGQGTPSDSATVVTAMSDLDDDISVTSTSYPDEGEDFEYEVEDVLAEEVDHEDVLKYLVRWKTYPLEMSTWEPRENFTPEVLEDIWEQKKRQPSFRPFDRRLLDEAHRAKRQRHIRRNCKRKRLGLAETPPFLEPLAWPIDNAISASEPDTDGATLIADESRVASPVLATTESHDSSDDLMVIEAISAPPREKKKKRPLDTEDDSSTPAKKKKKRLLDTKEDSSTPTKKKKAKNGKHSSEQEKADKKDKAQKKTNKKDTTAKTDVKKEKKEKKRDKVEKPAAKGEPKKKVLDSPDARKKPDAEGKPLVKGTSLHPETSAAPKPIPSTSKPKAAASHASPFSEKLAERCAKLAKTPSGPVSTSAPAPASTPASAPTPAVKEVPPKKAVGANSTPNTPTTAPTATSVAKTTGPAPAPAPDTGGNAFSGGKRSRAGRSLSMAMSDPRLAPQLFENRSTLRRAELCERDKADRAIDPSQLSSGLFPIASGPPAPLSTATSLSPGGETSPTAPAARHLPPRPILRRADTTTTADTFRRRKWVRFSDNDGSDAGLLLGRTRLKSPPAVSKRDGTEAQDTDDDTPMHDDAQEPLATQPPTTLPPVPVKLLFGAQKEPVQAMLEVTAESGASQQLLDEVITGKTLRFGCSFLAATLLQQIKGISKENMFSGNVRAAPKTETSAGAQAPVPDQVLKTVSQRLKLMASGLIHVEAEHAVLVYPAPSEEWPESVFGFPVPAEADATVALRYVVFSTLCDCAALLRPAGRLGADYAWLSDGQDRRHVMEHFQGLSRASFLDLLPDKPAARKKQRTTFFLAFPPTLRPFMFQLALWLREMDAECVVLFGTQAGAWMLFLRDVEEHRQPGVVIVHELATDSVRRFPYLRRLVSPGRWNCRVWSLSQGTHASPTFYPIAVPRDDAPAIGRIAWTELFPHGLALLLTPSVILSDPIVTYNILRWVSAAARSGRAPVTLVVAWDLCDHLKAVADDRRAMWHRARQGEQTRFDVEMEDMRLSEKQCLLRYEAWDLASELCDGRTQTLLWSMRGADWPTAVVFADAGIDANDEQSLVNWFGWWSTLYMDQYRAFYVVGSETPDTERARNIMTRQIRVPDFVGTTEHAADTAKTAAGDETGSQPPERPRKAQAQTAPKPAGIDPRRDPRPVPARPAPSMAVVRHTVQHADWYKMQLLSWNRAKNFWKIYGFVVNWRDPSEAFAHGLVNTSRDTFRAWLSFTWPFENQHRSYIGLFNLLDDDGGGGDDDRHGTAAVAGGQTRREVTSHPWVAIWRPVNPHLKHVDTEKTELILWDPYAGQPTRAGAKLTRKQGLSSGQRALVDYVRQQGATKNPGTHLSRVWIRHNSVLPQPGPVRAACETEALEMCLCLLRQFVADFNFVMPPSGPHLERLKYRLVVDGVESADSTPEPEPAAALPVEVPAAPAAPVAPAAMRGDAAAPAATRTQPSTATSTATDKRTDAVQARMVFHPPRGTSSETQCQNRLYQEALRAKEVFNKTDIRFLFRRTTDWYREQEEEGRGFEHVHVEPASEVCRTFGIPTGRRRDSDSMLTKHGI